MNDEDFRRAYAQGYAAAEAAIVKWLRQQVPRAACRTLANWIAGGAHLGDSKELRPLHWEIPITIEGGIEEFNFVKECVQELGIFVHLQLCGSDSLGYGYCVVPVKAIRCSQAYAIGAALSKVPHVASVGEPIAYPDGPAEKKGSPR